MIFEDEYENEPGVVVPRRSTRVKLTCCAYGGELGGNFTVDLSGMGALKLVSGTPPSSRTIAPYETVTFEAEYEAEKASSHEDGTVAKVKITENETNQVFDDDDKVTVVEIVITPEKFARDNALTSRHKFGICEVVCCYQYPAAPVVTWQATEGIFDRKSNAGYQRYNCPLYAAYDPITIKLDECEFIPDISVIEPQTIVVEKTTVMNLGIHPGIAGYTGMQLEFSVAPFDVSFGYVEVEEVPNEMGVHLGYFALAYFSNVWYHTSGNGAGNWMHVNADNYVGIDTAAYTGAIPKVYLTGLDGDGVLGWYYGYLSWNIPYGWRRLNSSEKVPPYKWFAEGTRQELILEDSGTLTINKLGSWVSRSINDDITYYGVEQ